MRKMWKEKFPLKNVSTEMHNEKSSQHSLEKISSFTLPKRLI